MWGLWNQNVGLNQIERTTEVISVAAKWQGQRGTVFYRGDELLAEAHALLEAADVLVTYNGARFDVPHLNREFLAAGLAPPAPYEHVDLYRVVKRQFRFASNRLQHVATELGLEGKVSHGGFELWRSCMANDPKAWREMERYNKRDVTLLEELYALVLPWIPNHPNRRLYEGSAVCPKCGSGDVQHRGWSYTRVSRFPRSQCKSCGGWFRDSRRDDKTTTQPVTP